MLMKIRLFFVTILMLLSAAVASAQSQEVSGVVTDAADGTPVPFASIAVKGTMTGTSAAEDGSYTINVESRDSAVLVFSFVGYKTVEIPVNGEIIVDCALEMEASYLSDAIVVAYGTMTREANTGAVTSIKNEGLAESPAMTVDKMLAGKMAGVQITSGSGQPGSTTTIRVRGTSSINAGNEPLWVIDGIPVAPGDFRQLSNAGVGGGSSTTFLNPNDIESITVLKDAAAASVYGSRAANGVIIVTTKTGQSGQAKFTARAKYGVQQLINDHNIRPLTGQELIDYNRMALQNAGKDPNTYTEDLLANGTTDWYKELTRLGNVQEYEINASGGTEKATYYSSLSYYRNKGVFYGVDYNRFTARVNADMQLAKKLKTGVRINFNYGDSNSGQMGDLYYSNPIYSMFTINPWTPMYDENGEYNSAIQENSNTNPRAVAAYDTYNDKEYRAQGTMYLEWKPIPQLTIKTTDSFEGTFVNSRQYWDPRANQGTSRAFQYASNDMRLTTSNTITYADEFAQAHNVRVTVGQEAMSERYEILGAYGNVEADIPYLTTSTTEQNDVAYSISEETLLSFFGIADYNYMNKYFIQGSVRADGSSLFGENTKWGVFWSVGGSWNISSEDWMQPVSSWFNLLKLRASYGVNGNNNITPYRAYGLYSSVSYNGIVTMQPSSPANPELAWERNKTWNAGLDFGFFNYRLTGSIDVYDRLTTDMLLSKVVPYTTGFSSNFMNTGSIRNRGVEFMIEGDIINSGDWNWHAGFNIAFNRSKVLDIGDSEYLTVSDSRPSSNGNNSTPVRIIKDRSLYTYHLRDWYGVNPSTGAGLWWTEDGKLTSDYTKARYVDMGSPEPKATGGFNTTVSWKGLSLSAYFEFVTGHKVFETASYVQDGYNLSSGQNTTNLALNYWKQPGDTGVTPIVIEGDPGNYSASSTRYLKKGDYLRIKDITLSYSLPDSVLKKIRMQGIRIYVSALNPYTFHDLNVLDPEVGYLGYSMGASHSMVKSFVGGIEVSF